MTIVDIRHLRCFGETFLKKLLNKFNGLLPGNYSLLMSLRPKFESIIAHTEEHKQRNARIKERVHFS